MIDCEWRRKATQFEPWDAVVLGAGPAGAIAARQLARVGLRVLLADKWSFPRYKVCGGCLGGAALDVLREVGLGNLPEQCGGIPLRSMQLASGGVAATIDVGRRIAVARDAFDSALVNEAIGAGADFLPETKGELIGPANSDTRLVALRHGDSEVTLSAKIVLIATGLSSSTGSGSVRVWPNSRVGLGTLINCPSDYGDFATLFMACGGHGYVGIAPIDGNRLDVAAAVDPAALARAESPGVLIGRIVREEGLPPLAGLEVAAWRGTPLLTRQARTPILPRCLYIGDAAGYVEPFTGEGIGWAMRSAVLASTIAQQVINTGDSGICERWPGLYAREIIVRQRNCRWIKCLLRSNLVRQLAIRSLRRVPKLAGPLVRRFDKSLGGDT